MQLNDTTTLFLGGRDNYARRISSYDWSTNKFTVHKTVWHSKHRKGSCAVIKGERGKPLVVLTGDAYKSSTGLEIWNPADERIQIEAIPFEEENNYRLSGVGLTAVNQGRDLLMYGGVWHDAKDSEELWKDWYKEVSHDKLDTVWKFNFASRTWKELYRMEEKIEEPVAMFYEWCFIIR